MSTHLVCDVVVCELQDVPRQVAHCVQSHRAVLEEVSTCGEGTLNSTAPGSSSHFIDCCFPNVRDKLPITIIQKEINHYLLKYEQLFNYLATFLLDSLLPALEGETEQQENGQEEKNDRGKRHHLLVFLLSTPPALSLLVHPLKKGGMMRWFFKNKSLEFFCQKHSCKIFTAN